MFKNLFKKKAPANYEFPVEVKFVGKPKITSAREGMWVVCDNRIGILHKLSGDTVEVHYVDFETGFTTLIVNVPLSDLRQARYGEIPFVRRGFTLAAAKELGYVD